MDCDGWHKPIYHFYSICFSSTLNYQMLLYDGCDRHFYNRELNILRTHHIQAFTLNSDDSVHDQPRDNGKNLNPNNIYGNSRMNCMRKNITLNFTTSHMNVIFVEILETFKLSPTTITRGYLNKRHPIPL